MKFHMSLTEQRVTLRILPENDTEGAFLRVLCNNADVEGLREERNERRRHLNDWQSGREVIAQAAWISELDYNLEKVVAIEITQDRAPVTPGVHRADITQGKE